MAEILLVFLIFCVGLAFSFLFYPRISKAICHTTALLWGLIITMISSYFLALVNTFSAFIVGILIMYLLIFIGISIVRLKRRSFEFKKTDHLVLFIVLVAFLAISFSINKYKPLISTTDSLHYFFFGREIARSGTLLIENMGYFYRSFFGVGEAMLIALGRSFDLPFLGLINPLIFLSILSALFFLSLEINEDFRWKKKPVFLITSIIIILGTTGMFFVSGYYLNTHIISAYSLLASYIFFMKANRSDQKTNAAHMFLAVLALLGFFLVRVEAPIYILLLLIYSLQPTNHFSMKQLVGVYSPVFFVLMHLSVIYFAYPHIQTDFWTDNRLLLLLFSYVSFLILVMIKNRFSLIKKNIGVVKFVFPGFIAISLLFFLLDPGHQFENLFNIIRNLFNNPFAGNNLWGFFWWFSGIILLGYVLVTPENTGDQHYSRVDGISLLLIITYALLIIDLGFFRRQYSFGRWGDSAMRMFIHLAPIVAFWDIITIQKIVTSRKENPMLMKDKNKRSEQ